MHTISHVFSNSANVVLATPQAESNEELNTHRKPSVLTSRVSRLQAHMHEAKTHIVSPVSSIIMLASPHASSKDKLNAHGKSCALDFAITVQWR